MKPKMITFCNFMGKFVNNLRQFDSECRSVNVKNAKTRTVTRRPSLLFLEDFSDSCEMRLSKFKNPGFFAFEKYFNFTKKNYVFVKTNIFWKQPVSDRVLPQLIILSFFSLYSLRVKRSAKDSLDVGGFDGRTYSI